MRNASAALLCGCLCLAAFANDGDRPLEQWTAADVRAIIDQGTHVDHARRDEMLSFVRHVKDMDSALRLKIETNICESILDAPPPEHETGFDFVLALKNRYLLLAEISDFSFWRTNRTSMLRLADCLGAYCNVETNKFMQEHQGAYELDKAEWEREAKRHEREGTVFVMKPGRHMARVATKFRIGKSWNLRVAQYRKDVLALFLRHIRGCVEGLSPNERGRFSDEFAHRAKLSIEEKCQVFGPLPENSSRAADGPTTNSAISVSESISLAIESALVPDSRTGTIRVKEVKWLIESLPDVPASCRHAVESNICHRILDFPLATNAHTTTWALKQKRDLFYDMASLDYWKTNHVALLALADHLGAHAAVPTNSFKDEFDKARVLDQIEHEKAKEAYKHDKESPVNPWGRGLHQNAVWTRWRIAKIWNDDIRHYRGWLFGAFAERIRACVRVLPQEDGKHFIEDFIRRGKLSPEEARHVFGPLPGTDGGTACGAATNAIMKAP